MRRIRHVVYFWCIRCRILVFQIVKCVTLRIRHFWHFRCCSINYQLIIITATTTLLLVLVLLVLVLLWGVVLLQLLITSVDSTSSMVLSGSLELHSAELALRIAQQILQIRCAQKWHGVSVSNVHCIQSSNQHWTSIERDRCIEQLVDL
jgi:hypothetical protein